jgi:5-hydroxyisourate hydrolase
MAVVSSHILNGVDGNHAGGIKVRLINLDTGETLFEAATDAGGRLKQEVPDPDPNAQYELTFQTAPYWATHGAAQSRTSEIVLRFAMPKTDGTYHSPIILSPNGYSLWTSN